MVVFDATYLMALFRPELGPPRDSNGNLIEKGKERLALLIATLEKARTKIIIPAPALSELLVRAGTDASQLIVESINKSSVMKIEAFDALAAIEVAAMTRKAIDGGSKKEGIDATWAKVKYDRQIVAIAKVAQATTIYSDDGDISTLATRASIKVVKIEELPFPPESPQPDLFERGPIAPDEAEIAAAEIESQLSAEAPAGL